MRTRAPIEPGLIRIFRFFVWAETLAFSLVPLGEMLFTGQPSRFYEDPFYIIFIQAFLLAIYLSIPWLQRKLRHYYLLIALLSAILIPTMVVIWDNTVRHINGQPTELFRLWALLPLLMIALVPTAWQYEFRSVFVLFAGLGLVEGAHLIWLNGRIAPDLLMPLFSIFIRVVTLNLVGLMITELVHTQREQRRKLMRANLQISSQALMQEQLAVSRERNRLARELHDTLAHTLSGLTVQLEAIHTVFPLRNKEISEMVDTALVTARTGLEETRRALKSLRAEPLEDMGLILAVNELVNAFQSRSMLSVEIDFPESVKIFSKEEEQSIYRIIQEALENVVRHAQAERVWLSLQIQNGEWQLIIRDNGKGFDTNRPASENEGLGLRGIREHAEMMGAEFKLQSNPGAGTALTIRKRHD
jgi:signal transduction histidine kinase